MKKVPFFLVVMWMVIASSNHLYAIEESKTKYFGVGATVEELEQATFVVNTKGIKPDEGFVFTPEEISKNDEVGFEVSLQGTGSVYLKVIESDAKGKFINEQSSPMILLTDDWTQYNFSAPLNKVTKQVDILILTGEKQKIEFQFRDVNLKT